MPIWRPEAVLIDVSETLFDTTPLRAQFEKAGLPATALDVWMARVQRDGIALAAAGTFASFADLGTFHLHALLDKTAAEADAHALRILDAFWELRPHADVADGLDRMREGKLRRATLSNEPMDLASAWLDGAGLRHLFEQVFDASAVMTWKPRAEPYVHAVGVLGSAIERTALISAHPWDIHGATCAGLVGAWLNRQGTKYPEMMNPPHVEASTLVELADRLLHLPGW